MKYLLILLLTSLIAGCNKNNQKQLALDKEQAKVKSGLILNQIIDNKKRLNLIENNSDTIQFKYGKYFGSCIEYCDTSIWFTSEGIKHVITSTEKAKKPPKIKVFDIKASDYKKLIDLISLDKIKKLDNRIGCPDCNDTGAEWIDLKSGNINKKITFENFAKINEIEDLMNLIRSTNFKD